MIVLVTIQVQVIEGLLIFLEKIVKKVIYVILPLIALNLSGCDNNHEENSKEALTKVQPTHEMSQEEWKKRNDSSNYDLSLGNGKSY